MPIRRNETRDRWDVDRYLLGDASLDHVAFEQQMLCDESLAREVAARVAQLQRLTLACHQLGAPPVPAPPPPAPTTVPAASGRKRLAAAHQLLFTCLTLAAALWLALMLWETTPRRDTPQQAQTADDPQLAEVALRWLALASDSSQHNAEIYQEEVLSSTASHEWLELGSEPLPGSEGQDWMLDVASEFFQEADI